MTSPQSNKPLAFFVLWLDHFLEKALIALVALMVVNVLWQISTRFLLGDPSSYTEELARFMLIWLALLGGVYAFRKGSNIGFDLLTDHLSLRLQKVARWFAMLVVMFFAAAVMCYGGYQLMMLTFVLGQTSASLGVPMGVVYSIIPISGLLIILYAAINLFCGVPPSHKIDTD